jgi:hypothetical protein
MTTLPNTAPSTIRAKPSRASAREWTESTTGSLPLGEIHRTLLLGGCLILTRPNVAP